MKTITDLSAAQLVRVYNAVTDGVQIKKFESTPRGLERTLAELTRLGVPVEDALVRAGVNAPNDAEKPAPLHMAALAWMEPAPAPAVLNLATGEAMPKLTSLHGPLRDAPANPATAARAVARKAGKAARDGAAVPGKVAAEAPAEAPRILTMRGGWKRTNATVPAMLEAMRTLPGKTLAELTEIAKWQAPVELRHLRKMEAKRGVRIVHDEQSGEARRYWIAA